MDAKNLALLKDTAADLGISLDKTQLAKFEAYYSAVTESNKSFNLTSIVDEREFVIKHFIDSLTGYEYIKEQGSLIDIGSGAGFPAIPLAIAGVKRVVALDSTMKKVNFINSACCALNIANVKAICGRAEESRAYFEQFDVVTGRAVASLSTLMELAAPFLKVHGLFVAYRTDGSEAAAAVHAMQELNMRLVKAHDLTLPNGDPRAIIVYEKLAPTPKKYPRAWGAIKRNPL